MDHCATGVYNVYFSARMEKENTVLYIQTLRHALPKKSHSWAQPGVLTANAVLPLVLRWWFVYWSKYCTIHLMTGFIPVNNIPGILLTPGILNAYKTHIHHTVAHSSFLLGSASTHSQFLKLCSISGFVKRNWGVLMRSKHSEDIQTENRSFMQVKPPFRFLTCQEKMGKLQSQKTPCTLSVWNLAATFRHRDTHSTRFAIISIFWK